MVLARQKPRAMEPNGEPRNNSHTVSRLLPKVPKIHNKEKAVYSINGFGKPNNKSLSC